MQDQNALCIDDVAQIDKSQKVSVLKSSKRKLERFKMEVNDQTVPIVKS